MYINVSHIFIVLYCIVLYLLFSSVLEINTCNCHPSMLPQQDFAVLVGGINNIIDIFIGKEAFFVPAHIIQQLMNCSRIYILGIILAYKHLFNVYVVTEFIH